MLLKFNKATVRPMRSADLDGFDICDTQAVDVKGAQAQQLIQVWRRAVQAALNHSGLLVDALHGGRFKIAFASGTRFVIRAALEPLMPH